MGKLSIADPPVNLPGMLTVVIDLDGSLRRFAAVPPDHEAPPTGSEASGLGPALCGRQPGPGEIYSRRAGMVVFRYDGHASRVDRILQGSEPIFLSELKPHRFTTGRFTFRFYGPGRRQPDWRARLPISSRTLRSVVNYAIGAIVFIAALWIAHYNWKAGRVDLRGATRVGIFCGVMSLIAWILHAHHVASDAEQTLIGNALANAAYVCLEYWLIYLALEPWVRRYWPQTMITWSRVVAGKWTDPVVGRDLLFGTFFGIVYVLIIALYEYANLRIGVPILGEFGLENLNGFRAFAGYIARLLFGEVGGSLTFLLTLFLVRAVLKKQWIVGTVWVVGMGGGALPAREFH